MTDVFWHGSPTLQTLPTVVGPKVRLGAFWAAQDTEVAALYAGLAGWLLPISVAPGATVLDVSGGLDGTNTHPIDRKDFRRLNTELRCRGVAAPGDGWGFGSPLRHWESVDSEDPCWEALLHDAIPAAVLGASLCAIGFDAVWCHDSTEGIEYDVYDRACAELAARLVALPDCDVANLYQDEIKQRSSIQMAHVAVRNLERRTESVPVMSFLHVGAMRLAGDAVPAGEHLARLAGGGTSELFAALSPP